MHSNRAGLLYALAGFSLLSFGDAIIKGMAGEWPPTAMAAARYIFAALFIGIVLAKRDGVKAVFTLPNARIQWMRGLSVSVATIAMFTAIMLMPLAEATTITFTQPMITAVLAAIFLSERIKPAAIGATVLAFVGVVIVLRPNFAAVGPVALLPLLTATAMGCLMIANRVAAHRSAVANGGNGGGALAAQYYISVTASVVLTLAVIVGHFTGVSTFKMHWPEWSVLARCAFISISASLAHGMIYMGTARAGAATIAPMNYGQLLTAAFLGWTFFGETTDFISLLGAAIIIGAGLILWRINHSAQPILANSKR